MTPMIPDVRASLAPEHVHELRFGGATDVIVHRRQSTVGSRRRSVTRAPELTAGGRRCAEVRQAIEGVQIGLELGRYTPAVGVSRDLPGRSAEQGRHHHEGDGERDRNGEQDAEECAETESRAQSAPR
jgi:hypothetical protein